MNARQTGGNGLGVAARLLVTATTASAIGDWMFRLALPLLVYRATGSALSTSVIYALEYLPCLLMSPLAGVLADRFDRRRLVVSVDCAATFVVAALALLAAFGAAELPVLYAGALVLGALAPVHHPAFQGLVPSVVRPAGLSRLNGRLQTAQSVAAVVGSLAGGVVVALVGPALAFGVDAASFAVSAAALVMLAPGAPAARAAEQERPTTELREALGYIRRDEAILVGASLFAAVNFAVFAVYANLVVLVVHDRHLSTGMVGGMFAAQAAGAAAGGVLAPTLGRRLPPGRLIVAGTAVAGLAMLPLALARTPEVIAALLALEAAAGTITAVAWFTFRASRVPERLLGRVVALTRMAAFAAIPAGSLFGGAVAGAAGELTPVILLSGGLQLAIAAMAAFSVLGRTETVVPAPARG